jgi:hypothetical protein
MEILRVPSSTIAYTVTGLTPGDYGYSVVDLADHSVSTGEVTVTSDSQIVNISLPDSIDGAYEVSIAGNTEVVDVIRPYVDPTVLGTTATEVEEYKINEMVARSIIDTKITKGFYNKKIAIQGLGQGSDFFPLWEKVNSILKVYENDVLVYDSTAENNTYSYYITLDGSAIYRVDPSDLPGDTINRIDYRPLVLPTSSGDLGYMGGRTVAFPDGYNYTFIVDAGNKNIPSDIIQATKMLIEDLKCGKLEYYKRYMTAYNTDQFRIQFDKTMLDGTGNFIVDKILEKYENTITKPGVL